MNRKLKDIIEMEKHVPTGLLVAFFSKNLKNLRESDEMTQFQMSQKLNVPVSTYANWEQGRREPSIADIYKILYTLDITPNELFDWD